MSEHIVAFLAEIGREFPGQKLVTYVGVSASGVQTGKIIMHDDKVTSMTQEAAIQTLTRATKIGGSFTVRQFLDPDPATGERWAT